MLSKIKKNKVLVIGDILLDKYSKGEVTRISPEAPIPIVKITEESNVLGGAANVANNIATLESDVYLAGIIGNDFSGREIIDLCKKRNIQTDFTILSENTKTIVKNRVVGNKQQLIRIDYNDELTSPDCELTQFTKNITESIKNFDIIVISDYKKGTCTQNVCQEVIKVANRHNIPVIVDPKGTNWEKYKGAYMITPNVKELSEAINIKLANTNEAIEQSCQNVCTKFEVNSILLTRSEKGMTLINSNNTFKHLPSQVKDVYDVTGAGDTVVSVIAVFLNNTHSILDTLTYANTAAEIVVCKLGTATTTIYEIEKKLMEQQGCEVKNKIHALTDLVKVIEKWKSNGETIAFTNGCFDIFHKGHVHSIYSASEFADRLVVAINSDSSVRKLKGPERPINSEYDRAYVIAALGCVDAVIIFEEDTPLNILSKIKPCVLVKGGDYKIENVVGREHAKRVELVNFIDGYSSTNIINKMST